MNNLSPFFHVY